MTETRIIRREAEAEGGSLKFIVVGLIVFIVATVGVIGLVVMTCNNDSVRMSVATNLKDERKSNKDITRDSNAALQMSARKGGMNKDENGDEQEMDRQFHPADVDIFNSSSSKFMSK